MTLRVWVLSLLAIWLLFCAYACDPPAHPDRPSSATPIEHAGGKHVSADEIGALDVVDGHRVYVPAYSHIYHRDDDVIYLTNTLSIRNTDEATPIYIKSIRYYDTKGKKVRDYGDTPMLLPAMATLEYVVGERDTVGGSGANFIIEWVADRKVSQPITECIMISTGSQQGISFLTRGVNVD